ncbi:hypothetical protein G7Z17_g1644 [Cylindrodendrum hubeiense]|uniref:PA14 domain-containing protein n=1 Tax=Cylindrodendrum hubeiense TaxID=595255 RepID=A0A9P5HMF0_9HYPO|nr:hypothetical protein G7Z17_g1644 [Cylindrodendrum hubeiense]
MRSYIASALVLLDLAASVAASPPPNFCATNAAVVAELKSAPNAGGATAYCSSYLSIKTSTKTTTVTSTPKTTTTTKSETVTNPTQTATSTTTKYTGTTTTVIPSVTVWDAATSTKYTSTTVLSCLSEEYYATAEPALKKRGAGKPATSIIPKTWNSGQRSSVCSCLSIPTPTTTYKKTKTAVRPTATVTVTSTYVPVTTTITTTVKTWTKHVTSTSTITSTSTTTECVVSTSIQANGIAYHVYEHTFTATADSGFTSTFFKGKDAIGQGSVNDLNFGAANWPDDSTAVLTLDDQTTYTNGYIALLFNGFFIAQETGEYTISTRPDYVDNWGYLWTENAAYADWDDTNARWKAERTNVQVGGEYKVYLTKGDAKPLTYLWANGGGIGQSDFQIETPSGAILHHTNGYFVQACDASIFDTLPYDQQED